MAQNTVKMASKVLFAYFAAFKTSEAGMSKIMSELNELMSGFSDAAPSLRALSPNTIAQLQNYGCWCYFEDDFGMGRGKPVDQIDRLCQNLHDSYECAILESGDGSCIPWKVDYNSSGAFDLSDRLFECENHNVDDCTKSTCIIEGIFVQNLFDHFMNNGLTINEDYKVQNGFDPATCMIQRGIAAEVRGERQCCGEVPFKRPFNDGDGEKACCGGVTYRTAVMECCPDETLRIDC